VTAPTAQTLIARARAALDRDTPIPQFHTVRIAAWLGRLALETLVIATLARYGVDAARASMRTRLSCLQILEPELARDAATLWWGLSRCCHHHAYELAPSVTEIEHYLDLLVARSTE
jgi:hypothetical protein